MEAVKNTNIRLPKDLYTDLRTIATLNHVTVTEYMRGLARPYKALQRPERYVSLVAIRETIAHKTAFADAEAITAVATATTAVDFHGLTLFPGESGPVHRVVKYEGQNTADVVNAYAENVWNSLNNRFPTLYAGAITDDSEYQAALVELLNHSFIIGRVNFADWRVFDSARELDIWRKLYGSMDTGAGAENEDEWAVWGWAKANLPRIYAGGSSNEGELAGQLWLNVYSDVKEESLVELWARICVQNYRETRAGVEELAMYDFRFIPRRIEQPKKKRVPHIKEEEPA